MLPCTVLPNAVSFVRTGAHVAACEVEVQSVRVLIEAPDCSVVDNQKRAVLVDFPAGLDFSIVLSYRQFFGE